MTVLACQFLGIVYGLSIPTTGYTFSDWLPIGRRGTLPEPERCSPRIQRVDRVP